MRSFSLALGVVAGLFAAPLPAQIPTGGRIGTQPAVALPRLMVSNPYVLRSADSATSVQIGAAVRIRMERVANGVYNVMTRDQMNSALVEYQYPKDAILTLPVQRQFASAVNARVLLSSTMARTQAGKLSVTARLAGLNDDAGTVVIITQNDGQTPEALGAAVADQFQPTVKAGKDAKACIDQRTSDPKKAEQAARRALATASRNGLAYLCLANLAIDAKAGPDTLVALLSKATEGDPQSLQSWALLAQQHQLKNDTAKVVDDYKAMLKAAPSNEELRKEAFQYFLRVGRTDAAREAVEEALKADEYNPDLYDLLSNVCVFENNYKCAVDALESLYAIDSTKADSSFFTKITVFAAQPSESPDTTRLIKWAQAGVNKYPTNVTLMNQLLGGYAMKGPMDSTMSIARRLIDLDTTTAAPVLLVVNQLAQQDSILKAAPLIELIKRRGSTEDKENASILLVNAAFKILQRPAVDSGIRDTLRLGQAANVSRWAISLADSSGRAWPNANYALGLSTVFEISKVDPEAEHQKSCDLARREDSLVQEAGVALVRGRSVNPTQVDGYIRYIESLKPRTASMIRAYCH
jgi:tetratricopeptide (TPR) repeat protein